MIQIILSVLHFLSQYHYIQLSKNQPKLYRLKFVNGGPDWI